MPLCCSFSAHRATGLVRDVSRLTVKGEKRFDQVEGDLWADDRSSFPPVAHAIHMRPTGVPFGTLSSFKNCFLCKPGQPWCQRTCNDIPHIAVCNAFKCDPAKRLTSSSFACACYSQFFSRVTCRTMLRPLSRYHDSTYHGVISRKKSHLCSIFQERRPGCLYDYKLRCLGGVFYAYVGRSNVSRKDIRKMIVR